MTLPVSNKTEIKELMEKNEQDFSFVTARAARFWSFVAIGPISECWPWTRYLSTKGYARFYVGKDRTVLAHRAAWMLANDRPVPRGRLICHSCDNPKCCNPSHLWPGTDADNNADRARKGRTIRPIRDEEAVGHARGVAHPASKLTEEQVLAIRADKRSLPFIAAQYGISQSTASRVRSGKYYPRVQPLLQALQEEGK